MNQNYMESNHYLHIKISPILKKFKNKVQQQPKKKKKKVLSSLPKVEYSYRFVMFPFSHFLCIVNNILANYRIVQRIK